MMSNLSAESFPDDSIIHNISLHPPLLPAVVISGEASSSDSGPAAASAQLQQSSAPIIARPPLSMRSALLQKTASIPPSDFELELLNNVATLSIFDSLSSKARSLSPESLCDRSTSTTTSTASTSDRSTSTTSSSTKFTKSATATASSSNASGSSSGVSTSTGGVSRRLGAAFKQHGASGSAPMLLSKKSASVDSLHHPGAGAGAADKSLQPRRSQRYDHVRSKVKEYIDTQREEDQRRRMATKFQRHRSMPESLYDPLAAAAATISATAAAQPDAAALGELRSTLRHKDAQLAEMEQTIRSLHLCYEVSMRDHDDKVRLERKVEVMRLELLQANNERRHYQDELQLLLLKKQQAASSSASSCSASAASSTASTTGSYRLPGPISLMNTRTNAGSVSYGESSVGSASSSSASAAEFAVVESAMSTGNGGKTGGGGSGLHLRPSAAAAAADKASPGGRRGANMSAGSAHSMRQIIVHSGTSDYRLLGDHDHDDDRAAADAQSDDDDDGDIALFDQSAVRGGAIISSSSMSMSSHHHDDRLSDVANAGFAMSPGCAGGGGPRRKVRGGRRRRIGRAIRKRLRRMLGRCGACLDAAGKEDSGSDRYDSMADISLLYTGLNSGGGGPEGGDESTATATTGYNSFS